MTERLRDLLAIGILAIVVGSAGFWAGSNALQPPQLAVAEPEPLTYRIAVGTIGRTIDITVTAAWETRRTLPAMAAGIVTTTGQPGALAREGDVLLTVNLQPVVVIKGTVPMFRSLEAGLSGQDVAQLQRFLLAGGFLHGSADGRFGPSTVTAVSRWQRALGLWADGKVDVGRILFVEPLPARMVVVPAVGESLTQGRDLVRVLDAVPTFRLDVSSSQRAELTTGTTVTLDAVGGGSWVGTIGAFLPRADGRFEAPLLGGVCAPDSCGRVAVEGQTQLTGRIVEIQALTGPVIPTSALTQQPSGALAVTLGDGTVHIVRVLGESDGFAVIEGLEPGTAIELPAVAGQ